MKILMSFIFLIMLSCGNALPLSEQTTFVKEGIDTVVDIESRFGEPIKFYKEHDRTKAYFVAKYENILDSEVVYLRFVHVQDIAPYNHKRKQKDRFIFAPDLREKFKQDWVLYEIDKRPNKHS
jgi:hypothetical protein